MTLTTPSLISTSTPTDPHAHHGREALALHRVRRRARRHLRLAKLLATLRAAAAPIDSQIRWRDAEPSAAGSGGGVDL